MKHADGDGDLRTAPRTQAWERYRNRARKTRDLAVLMELAAWREAEAQGRDVPRSRVLKDDIMIEIALAAPRSVEALGDLRAFPKGMERSKAGGDILAAIERGLARDPKSLSAKVERDRRSAGEWGCDRGTAESAVCARSAKAMVSPPR